MDFNWNTIAASIAGSVLPTLAVLWAKHHIQELHLLINSRMTELLAAARAQATAEATLIEKEAANGHKLDQLAGAQEQRLQDMKEKT
jgi:hypothetical protein